MVRKTSLEQFYFKDQSNGHGWTLDGHAFKKKQADMKGSELIDMNGRRT